MTLPDYGTVYSQNSAVKRIDYPIRIRAKNMKRDISQKKKGYVDGK